MPDAHAPQTPDPTAPPQPSAAGATLFDLVATCLDRMEHEGHAALEALCAEHPAHAARLRTRIAQLGAFGLAGEAPHADAVPERLGQFRLLARLGGGGMGIVYAAEQDGLQRRVALKLVRPGTVYFPGARERFRREVEVLARLQHPGIVPVYAGGEENGVPYLAMELVRGATLEEALAELPAVAAGRDAARLTGRDLLAAVNAVVARRDAAWGGDTRSSRIAGAPAAAGAQAPAGAPGATPASRSTQAAGATPRPAPRATASASRPGATPSGATPQPAVPSLYAGNWVITCTRLARRVAEALVHAHGQGVLHRDIKPSNVMLDPEGRVLLLDFGLASAEGSTRLTSSGQPLGSPAYMSPEQVRGERGAVDARADVWSLGVTLYEALTLHQPFATDDLALTSRLVLAANPPAPRTRNPAVPPDLETVVLAALERDAARRYAGPAELARDLANVLELRPITVSPPSAARRLLRWTQRRPALATACVLGGLLLVAGPLGWELQRRKSMESVLAARDSAERNFQAALAAIGSVLRDVATKELEDVPRMQRARLVAIDRALELFPQLERDRPDDEAVLDERAELHLSRADILRDLGRPEEAVPEFEEVLALRRRLSGLHDDPSHAMDLAAALDRAAKVRFALGRVQEAVPLYEEAVALQRTACAAQPDRVGWSYDLALVLANLAETLGGLNRNDEARAALQEALAVAERVLDARPEDAQAHWTMARIESDFATLLDDEGDSAAALPVARRSLEAYTRARDLDPSTRFYAFDVAMGHQIVAQCLSALGRLDECEAEAHEALAILDELVRDYPDVLRYRDHRGKALEQLGIAAARKGQPDEALRNFEARVADLDEACRLAPERTDLAYDSAMALNNLSVAKLESGADADETLAILDRAQERLDVVFAGPAPPRSADRIQELVKYGRARVFCYADRLDEARQAVEAFESEAGADSFRLRYGADLWNELILTMRRLRAAAAASASASGTGDATTPKPGAGERAGAGAFDEAAEADAKARMYAMLAAALDAGYADLDELKTTPSLDSFRDEPEFQALLARLTSP